MIEMEKEIALTLRRLEPRVESILAAADRDAFCTRLRTHFPTAFRRLYEIYGQRYDFFYHLEQIVLTLARMYADRAADLKALDRQREADPGWFSSQRMMGAMCYVDLFAGDLTGVRDKISYFKELKLTYLHLMPLFRCPPEESDGGYAVSSYREVNPDLGTVEQLTELAAALRAEGISLVLDFVFNHTSDEHRWALNALAGDEEYQAYYRMFDDRTLPDQYEQHLREIFPEQDPGSFTFRPEIDKWVWTTFNHFQWDLNYANPVVFCAMLEEMLAIANMGAEVLRLDAIAFIWKELGTPCEGLPQVHTLIQAYNALVRIAAPALVFKSEAIVHPAEVASYIAPEEAPLSYNPTMMALIWETLATREVRLLRLSMERRFALPPRCSWINYVRCHDDIGWTFADEDAGELGINGFDHRQFLNRFYTGEFPGSFARGLPFNFNPVTRDMRISGMAASLAGLEYAQDTGDSTAHELAQRRLELIHSVILSAGGIPVLYLGDEIAMLNDYGYKDDPGKADDSRWAHRPPFDWARAEQRHDPDTDAGRIFTTLTKLIDLRRATPALANGRTRFLDVGNPHVLCYVRGGQVLVLANFSEHDLSITPAWLPPDAVDLVTGEPQSRYQPVKLNAYRFAWLAPGHDVT